MNANVVISSMSPNKVQCNIDNTVELDSNSNGAIAGDIATVEKNTTLPPNSMELKVQGKQNNLVIGETAILYLQIKDGMEDYFEFVIAYKL